MSTSHARVAREDTLRDMEQGSGQAWRSLEGPVAGTVPRQGKEGRECISSNRASGQGHVARLRDFTALRCWD